MSRRGELKRSNKSSVEVIKKKQNRMLAGVCLSDPNGQLKPSVGGISIREAA